MKKNLIFDASGVLSGIAVDHERVDAIGGQQVESWAFATPEQAARHLPQFAADLTKGQRDKLAAVNDPAKVVGA